MIKDIPLELSFHNMASSDALKAAVREHVNKLEQFHDHIIGCRVVLELPHRSQKASGNPPDVHIVVRVPGKEIVVSKELAHNGHKQAATDAYAVLVTPLPWRRSSSRITAASAMAM